MSQEERRAQRNLKQGIKGLGTRSSGLRSALQPQPAARSSWRYGYGLPPHREINAMFKARDHVFAEQLLAISMHADAICEIPIKGVEGSISPCWHNSWFFGLDAVALYGLIAHGKPRRYYEVGSGYSTMFARRAVADHHLDTEVLSIDPQPRANIDAICDRVIRRPLEEVDLTLFYELSAGDILFIDSSHVCAMNSDVTVFFMEILPRLAPGVLVQIHDVFLPWDYRPDWTDRQYSEQYLLGAYLLGGAQRHDVLLPNFYVFTQPRLSALLDRVWTGVPLSGYETAGHSFWMRSN